MPIDDTADSANSPQPAAPKASKAKRILLASLFFVLLVAAAYGVGRFQTASLIRDAEGRAQATEEKRQAALAAAKARHALSGQDR